MKERQEVERYVQRMFADAGVDVQAWPWWSWIDMIVDDLIDEWVAANA